MKILLTIVCMCAIQSLVFAQNQQSDTKFPPPVSFSNQQDHANMMEQLGITETRPGKSGNPDDPNSANYEESLANPCPVLPELMVAEDGTKITSQEQWWNKRRPEIAENFEREVYGRIPDNVPDVSWDVEIVDQEWVGRIPVTAKKVIGHVDNSAYPQIEVNIEMMVVVPTNVEGPVPVLMMFGMPRFPAPAQPNKEDLEKINKSFKSMLIKNDPSMKEIFEKYPAYQPVQAGQSGFNWFAPPIDSTSSREDQLLAAGWGYATISTSSIQADNAAGLTSGGIIALTNHGKPRTPEQWGSLRAWAWGAARGLDYLETDSLVDASKVGIEGVSRYGKAALVTMAFEDRFAVGLIGSSGKGGVTLHRRFYGETVENLAGSGAHHWMAGNYINYSAEKGDYGKMTGCDLPVDSHELIALAAPRPLFVSYGIPEQGDAHWLDQKGSYMATIAAQPAYTLLGASGLGKSSDYMTEEMPEPLTNLLDGELGWRQHIGGHTDQPNIQAFVEWANRMLGYKPEPKRW